MPMHDWSTISAGTYHNFHIRWTCAIMDRLNGGLLPADCFAMAEQVLKGPIPDVVTLHLAGRSGPGGGGGPGGLALAEPKAKPTASVVMAAEDKLTAAALM